MSIANKNSAQQKPSNSGLLTDLTFKRSERSLVKKKPIIIEDPFDDIELDNDALHDLEKIEMELDSSQQAVDDAPATVALEPILEIHSSPMKPFAHTLVLKALEKQADKENDETELLSNSAPAMKPKSKRKVVEEPVEEVEPKKFNYRAYLEKKTAPPKDPGSKEIPEGSENCFSGLVFVFTGELSSIGREEATDLVKRCGGKVTTAPSSRTSYVIVGEEAGLKKLEKIKELKISTLNEDEFFELIKSKSAAEEKKSTKLQPATEHKKVAPTVSPPKKIDSKQKMLENESDLWTVKYRPKRIEDFIGNHGNLSKLGEFLKTFQSHSNEKEGFRAALLSGPPGIGKTTAAYMVSEMEGYKVVEFNASDTRSKKALHDKVRELTGNHTINEFFGAKQKVDHKTVILMDEVDGMSAGDRGGMAELIALIKKTKIPIICICNDRSSPKVRSLANHCLDLRFRRSDARSILSKLQGICEKEGLELKTNSLEELCASTHGDIRQILNILSTWSLNKSSIDFDEAKKLSSETKKDIDVGPFDITNEFLSGPLYAKNNINQKLEHYFMDNSLIPLMIQENYLHTNPTSSLRNQNLKKYSSIELASFAADSISDADILDSKIHGLNQEWSLAPLHGMFSCVIPSYFMHGAMTGRIDFPSWLGNYSKTTKFTRLLKELSMHVSLKASVGKYEFRLSYLPLMTQLLYERLISKGAEAVDECIALLDSYYMLKDDFDIMMEIYLGGDKIITKIPSAVKSAFTRKYNKDSHALPYSIAAIAKSAAISTATTEELNELEDVVEDEEEVSEKEDDIGKDKMIKVKPPPKAKEASSSKAPAAKRGPKAKK